MNILPRFFLALLLVLMFIDTPLSGPLENLLLVEKVEKASKAGNLELAERLSNNIPDTAMKNILLAELYEKYMKKNHLKSAERLLNKISDTTMQNILLVELGSKAIELKKCEMAGRLIEKAPTMSKLILKMEYNESC